MVRTLGCFLLAVLFSTPSLHAVTWHVPSPGCSTIQSGIDSAGAGDTVLVACGTYYESDIEMKSGVYLRSETGEAECVTIDAQKLSRVVCCDSVNSTTWIEGFTLRGGDASGAPREVNYGGGIYCYKSSLRMANCEFSQNSAGVGGGMYCVGSFPRLLHCAFSENSASDGGGVFCRKSAPILVYCSFFGNSADYAGALYCYLESSPIVSQCTFCGNSGSQSGGAMLAMYGSSPKLENTIIAFSPEGAALGCYQSWPTLLCCDIYGNAGGDWTECIAEQYGVEGNISLDPLFCDHWKGDLHLDRKSPCAPFSAPNVECDLIGAWPVGCDVTAVAGPQLERLTWSSLKSRRR